MHLSGPQTICQKFQNFMYRTEFKQEGFLNQKKGIMEPYSLPPVRNIKHLIHPNTAEQPWKPVSTLQIRKQQTEFNQSAHAFIHNNFFHAPHSLVKLNYFEFSKPTSFFCVSTTLHPFCFLLLHPSLPSPTSLFLQDSIERSFRKSCLTSFPTC